MSDEEELQRLIDAELLPGLRSEAEVWADWGPGGTAGSLRAEDLRHFDRVTGWKLRDAMTGRPHYEVNPPAMDVTAGSVESQGSIACTRCDVTYTFPADEEGTLAVMDLFFSRHSDKYGHPGEPKIAQEVPMAELVCSECGTLGRYPAGVIVSIDEAMQAHWSEHHQPVISIHEVRESGRGPWAV